MQVTRTAVHLDHGERRRWDLTVSKTGRIERGPWVFSPLWIVSISREHRLRLRWTHTGYFRGYRFIQRVNPNSAIPFFYGQPWIDPDRMRFVCTPFKQDTDPICARHQLQPTYRYSGHSKGSSDVDATNKVWEHQTNTVLRLNQLTFNDTAAVVRYPSSRCGIFLSWVVSLRSSHVSIYPSRYDAKRARCVTTTVVKQILIPESTDVRYSIICVHTSGRE